MSLLSTQAAALPQLCSQLRLAAGLRELVLNLDGRAGRAVPAKLVSLSCLTQLDSLRLGGIGHRAEGEHLSAALRPLTRLTRLSLRFVVFDDTSDDVDWDNEERRCAIPWASAVCRLTALQQLCITTDFDPDLNWCGIIRGDLPAALSRLTALRGFIVLGMDTHQLYRGSEQPLLPALETAALQLHTHLDAFPGLGRQQQTALSRVVSLSLALRYNVCTGLYDSTQLPVLVAPSLTELTPAGMSLPQRWQKLECSSKLSWLADLPSLRRLELKDLETVCKGHPSGRQRPD